MLHNHDACMFKNKKIKLNIGVLHNHDACILKKWNIDVLHNHDACMLLTNFLLKIKVVCLIFLICSKHSKDFLHLECQNNGKRAMISFQRQTIIDSTITFKTLFYHSIHNVIWTALNLLLPT